MAQERGVILVFQLVTVLLGARRGVYLHVFLAMAGDTCIK